MPLKEEFLQSEMPQGAAHSSYKQTIGFFIQTSCPMNAVSSPFLFIYIYGYLIKLSIMRRQPQRRTPAAQNKETQSSRVASWLHARIFLCDHHLLFVCHGTPHCNMLFPLCKKVHLIYHSRFFLLCKNMPLYQEKEILS